MANLDDKGCWKRQKILGDGAFGIVELWENDYTKNTIALKKCKGGAALLTPKQRDRWELEVRMMNSLKHPNIVETISLPSQLCDHARDIPVLCMEYCSLGDLRKMLDEPKNCCGIEEAEALRIMCHVSSAVEFLHSRTLAHRDLKPENVVVQMTRQRVIYKLADLGYARELGEESLDGSVVGTRNYLAPELLWKPSYNCSVDYWSLGILFYEVITGHRPFFPNEPITETWIRRVKKKKFHDICTRHGPENVVFDTEIDALSTLSDCTKQHLTPWFRVALQWDPKRRGKSDDPTDNPDNLVVFTMLKRLFTLKIIYVFVVSQYRTDGYVVYPQIRMRTLRELIRDKTKIDADEQIISDFRCNVVDKPDDELFRCIEVPNLVVFHRDNLRVENAPKPEIPSPVQHMIDNPRDTINHTTMKRYYGASLFFINRELDLFRSYVIAMCIKIDLSRASLESLRDNVRNLMTNVDSLINELNVDEQSVHQVLMDAEMKKRFDNISTKTLKLRDCTTEVGAKLDVINADLDEFGTISNRNWLEKWTKRQEEAAIIYDKCLAKSAGHRDSPVVMAKCLHQALRLRNDQLREPEIESFICGLAQIDGDMAQLRESLNSFHALVDSYRQKFNDIINERRTTNTLNGIQCMTDNDIEMFDNIMLSKLIDGCQDQFMDLMDFDLEWL